MSVDTAYRPKAGHILQQYLLNDAAARRKWVRRQVRHRDHSVSQAAVAQVLAEWLWDNGEVSELDVHLPRRLKDKVSRAFAGEHVPPRTLEIFILAFDIPPAVTDRLWGVHP